MYINANENENGNHGNQQSFKTALTVELPDSLLSAYLDTMGFANITVDEGKVTAVSVNQSALDNYKKTHSDISEENHVTDNEWLESQILYTAIMTDTLLEA